MPSITQKCNFPLMGLSNLDQIIQYILLTFYDTFERYVYIHIYIVIYTYMEVILNYFVGESNLSFCVEILKVFGI